MFTKNRNPVALRIMFVAILMSGMLGTQPAISVSASTLTVTNTNDSGVGSLRQTIIDAVAGDTINFDSSLSGQTIALASTIFISKNLTIDGSALNSPVTVSGVTGNDGTGNYRVFIIDFEVNATLKGLTIKKSDIMGYVNHSGGIEIRNNAVLTIVDCTLSDNLAGNGGAILNWWGTLIVTNSTLSNNSAVSGGGIYNQGGSATLTNVLITNNSALSIAGGIYNIGDLTVVNSTISNNSADVSGGGGIYNEGNLTLTNSIVIGNSSTQGGGIFNEYIAVSMNILNSTISNNTAIGGGGIRNSGPATVTGSTFEGNSADYGGGIYNTNTLTVTNSTFFGNSSGFLGGGIDSTNSTLTVANTTFSGNTSGIHANGSPTITNSILWGNTGGELSIESNSVVTSSIVQGGYAGISNLSINPLLGTLANYGGPTQTMILGAGSPAIDAGDDANCPEFDQRGIIRPQGGHCDIGAVETIVHYVKWDAIGADNGSSWSDAYTDLQSALSAASAGDEIWVAAGTYKPTSGADRGVSFILKNGVAVYGGFAGTESLLAERDYQTNITILSGDIGNSVDNSDNSYHVVVASGTDNSATFDGFTIAGGNADGSTLELTKGGGMYNNLGSPTVRNSIFDDNSATFGAGMYNYGDQYVSYVPSLSNVVFINNSSTEGGGMRNENYSSPILTDVTFEGNSAIRSGGGMENFGHCDPILTNVAFINNSGGASGGGIMNWLSNSPTLANVTFSGNTADLGGGISNYLSNPTLTNVTMNGNTATTYGGGISNENDSNPVVYNSIIWGNTAPASAQIYIDASSFTISDSIVEGGYAGGTNIITADPKLLPLADNGGPTPTMALLPGSPAIDAGDDANCPATDQRGVTRPQGSHCDIGAYEFNPKTLYVKWDASGAGDGSSWTNAYTDLQSALSAATSGDEIWVAAGTYKPTSGTNRLESFWLRNGVSIYGGFAGTESLLVDRDPSTNVTILSGDIGLTGSAYSSDNSYHVVRSYNVSNAVLDGFTIRDGWADALGHQDGGGMNNFNSSPTLKNIIFRDNYSSSRGGGMYNSGGSNPTLTNVTFLLNTAYSDGGGLCNNGSSPILTDVTFSENYVNLQGGGMSNLDNSNPAITNATFDKNTATFGGGMFNDNYSGPSLKNITFSDNSADSGGAIYNNFSGAVLRNVTISGNTAANGGGIYNNTDYPTSLSILNTIVWGNTGGEIVNANSDTPIIGYSVVQGGCPLGSDCTNIITTDPMLGTLGNDGGLTQTMALLAGSSAIDAGDDGVCPATDQRGVTRPQGSHCDIGAYEYEGSEISTRFPSADFNGDGKTDVAVFRPSNSTWYIQGVGAFVYGQAGDIPVPADYNGDGKDEIAVFRPSNGTWYILGVGPFVYGTVGDIPVPADYNGDGKDEIAIFRPSNSTWYIYGIGPFVYGTVGDIPVVADYNGDGKADIAVFRPGNSTWYIYGVGPRVYGTVGDIPVIADYNGDGKADIAVFRPTNSTWYLYGIGPRVYGTVGDIPVIGDYNGDGKADIAVFRPSNSTWYIYGVGPSVYGAAGDIPV